MTSNPVTDIYPLSPTQQGMLLHSLMAPETGVYVVQLCFTLHGELDESAFKRAWQRLAERHDVLRTAFAWQQLERPLQAVGGQVSIPCRFTDLSTAEEAAQQQEMRDWLHLDRCSGFKLSHAPLLRIHGFRLSEHCVRIVVSYHHLLMDGWSLPILLREWRQLYAAEIYAPATSSEHDPLAPAASYRDFISWLQNSNDPTARDFWREQLRGFQAPNRLGQDLGGNRPPLIESSEIQLPESISSALYASAKTLRVTTATLIQGAWAWLLGYYCDCDDVVFGVTRSGRPPQLPATQRMIGLFIVTLPLRVHLPANVSVVEWLRRLQQTMLAQQPHERLALNEIQAVSEIGAGRPLFDSIVVFENYPAAEQTSTTDALRVETVEVIEQTHYPLSLFAYAGARLEIKLQFDSQRFPAGQMSRLLDHFQRILEAFVRSPQLPLASLDPLSPTERSALQAINRTVCPPPAQTVVSAVDQQTRLRPGAIAITDRRGDLSYATLNKKIRHLTRRLRAHGIQPGQLVAVALERGADMVIALLAILRCGAAYVPLDARYPADRLRTMLRDSGACALILHEETRSDLAFWQGTRIDLDVPADVDCRPGEDADVSRLAHTAYVIYTSGSSGQPKGVAISHLNLANLLNAMRERTEFTENDRWLAVTTLCFDIAALEIFLPLAAGGRLIIAGNEEVRDAQRLTGLIDRYDISFLQATPSTWRMLLQVGWQGRPGMTLLSGGESLDGDLAEQLCGCGDRLWNVYGPTETTIWSGAVKLQGEINDDTPLAIGGALNNTCFWVLDRHLRPLPVGVAGELYIGGIGVGNGYHGQATLTAEKFLPNPILRPDDNSITHSSVLYRSGDRVRLREDGLLDFLGRIDRQIKLRGFRIEPEEIEQILSQHPAIAESAIIVRGREPATRLCAFYTLNTSADTIAKVDDLRRHLAEHLPAYMLPAEYSQVEVLPHTPNGKIDRNALRELKVNTVAQPAAPVTPLQTQLLVIWRELVDNPRIGINDNFFDIGGHSLLLISVQNRLRQTFGLDVDLVDLFRYPNVAALAKYLEQLSTDATAASTAQAQAGHMPSEGKQRLAERRRLRLRSALKEQS